MPVSTQSRGQFDIILETLNEVQLRLETDIPVTLKVIIWGSSVNGKMLR